MKPRAIFIVIWLSILSLAISIEVYDSTKSYSAGDQVSCNGDIYEAKWWAEVAQSPGDQVENDWDTPWKLVSEGGAAPPPHPSSVPPVDPSIEPTEATPPLEGEYPPYEEGGQYEAGDIVVHDNRLYGCKIGNWCSGKAWAYAPGTGTAWSHAWEETSEADIDNPQPPDSETTNSPSNPDGGYTITQSELDAKEKQLTDNPVLDAVKESIRTLDNDAVELVKPQAASNPENVKRIESILSGADWEFLFSERSPEYTYIYFLQATAKFPAFCGTYSDGRDSDAICRKQLATMFAHFTQETGGHTAHWEVPEWRQGLVHVREMGWNEEMRGGYNGECNPDVWQGQTWPCGTFADGEFKSYFGRGSKQLSYNYNYGPFSDAMFGTVRTLLDHPEMVADTWLNLASAVFFYTYPQPPKPSMLHVIDGTWEPNQRDISNGLVPGFGVTTQIINGGVECGGSVEIAQSVNRIDYYTNFAEYLNVEIRADEVLGCKGMKQFDADGAGATNIYWEQDWGWSPDTPSGDTYACQLIGYQTPFTAFKEGDYTKCVVKHYPDLTIES